MWQVSDIKYLDWDISSVCNAGCIDCVRWLWDSEQGEYHPNGHHPHYNQLYSLSAFADHIQQFDNLAYIQLLGNVGDPMAHNHIDRLVDLCDIHHPHARIEINTNGSIGAPQAWHRLIERVRPIRDRVLMVFSIDGLADTNHIYRRGCEWSRITERIQWWRQHDLRTEWKMIDFPYNAHQRETARTLAQDWGFESFTVFPRQTEDPEFDQRILDQSDKPMLKQLWREPYQADWQETYQQELSQLHTQNSQGIQPKCLSQLPDQQGMHHPNFQVNIDGTVWPCCWTSSLDSQKNQPLRNKWLEMLAQYNKTLGEGWNSLHHRSLIEILESDWFAKDLAQSWRHNDRTLSVCYQECGACVQSTPELYRKFKQ